MKWLLLLFIPLLCGSCYKIENLTLCEVEIAVNILSNSTEIEFQGFEEEIFISKQRFMGNFVFILIAVAAVVFVFVSLLKT